MEGQIIARKRLVSALLLQYQLLLSCILPRKHHDLEKKERKRFWIRKLFKDREEKSLFAILVKDLQLFDREYFFKNFRMGTKSFEELLSWVGPFVQKSSLRRSTATVQERSCVTLRYLCTGGSQITIGTSYRISPTTMGRTISETCQAIWYVLNKKGFIKAPTSKKEWLDTVTEFESKWNFPHYLGAIDGKYIIMQAAQRSGSTFFSCKKSFSIVVIAVCNANYEFSLVDVGEAGRQSDGRIYNNSKLGMAIDRNLLNIPEPKNIVSLRNFHLFSLQMKLSL